MTNFLLARMGGGAVGRGERFVVLPLYPVAALLATETDRIWPVAEQYGDLPER